MKKKYLNFTLTLITLSSLSLVAEDMHLKENMYEPAKEMMQMDEAMNKAIEQRRAENATMAKSELTFDESPMVDFKPFEDGYALEKNITDANHTKVDVTVKDRMVTISTTTTKQHIMQLGEEVTHEDFVTSSMESLSLPSDADDTKLQSSYKQGVLKVTVPKKKP
ncbi:MAG: hypothetical protein KU29_09265 [Sulfurovum sp. FS06-10]|nr:MAG: hypothetical protein KU29_09265 [Sulfurovum sp. FS06-10]